MRSDKTLGHAFGGLLRFKFRIAPGPSGTGFENPVQLLVMDPENSELDHVQGPMPHGHIKMTLLCARSYTSI